MIRFSKIDDKLTIYRGKKVILFGCGRTGLDVKLGLEGRGVHISYFCDHDPAKWGKKVEGILVLSPEALKAEKDERTIVQISCSSGREIEKQLRDMEIEYITYDEYGARTGLLYRYQALQQLDCTVAFQKDIIRGDFFRSASPKRYYFRYACAVKQLNLNSYNLICLCQKTGDHTLMRSIGPRHNIRAVNTWHSFANFPAELKQMMLQNRKQKIVTAVRDVVSQNLSCFFNESDTYATIPEFWRRGGDVQILFNGFLAHELGAKYIDKSLPCPETDFWESEVVKGNYGASTYCMQEFFEKNFAPYSHIDLYQYPFDKEKGYSILEIEDQNTEVFIYQLEKLDEIKDELGRFLGIEDFQLVNDNIGEEKWYGDAYRQAKKEIKLSRKYFDACYSSKVMTHFYSEADIERFKRRWSSHVID